MTKRVSIVITTRNRKDELRVALRSAFRQTANAEVIVIDDGSTDGTFEMVRSEFPISRLVRHDSSRGLIVRRNEGALLASGEIIFSIDDDAEFVHPDTVRQTVNQFDDACIAVVAIPYIEPKKDNRVMQQAPDADRWITDSFKGTAHALRRDHFLAVGGYRVGLVHQGEEGDLSIRFLASGLVVRLGTADPIYHYESPRRDWARMDYYGRRNDILFVWHNVPLPFAISHFLGTVFNGLRAARQARRWSAMLSGIAAGIRECVRQRRGRRPVSRDVYRLHRTLKTSGPILLDEVRADLPSGRDHSPCAKSALGQ